MKDKLKAVVPNWKMLEFLFNQSVFKFFGFIFFVFPFLVKLTIIVDNTLSIVIDMFGFDHNILIPFPFSLKILYIGSVGVFIGGLVFKVFYPKVMRAYATNINMNAISKSILIEKFSDYSKDSNVNSCLSELKLTKNATDSDLYKCQERLLLYIDESNLFARAIVAVFLVAGYLASMVIIAQNICVSFHHIYLSPWI